MLENNVIPIVNENDTISVSELMFTDNDELSGLIASMMDTQALIILSNIDGIYNCLLYTSTRWNSLQVGDRRVLSVSWAWSLPTSL